MTQQISRKMADFADLPLRMNLQLFGEDDEHDGVIDQEHEDDGGSDDHDQPEDMRGQRDDDDDHTDHEPEPETAKPEKPQQPKEVNDAFQKMRQEKEAAERRASELEAQRKRDLEVARKYGKEYGIYSDEDVANLYGASHGLTTVEQFEQQLQREAYEKAGLPPEMVEKMAQVDKYLKEQEARTAQEQKAKQDQALVEQYGELTTTYPDLVKAASDVPEVIWKRWDNGNAGFTLTEVYRAMNHDAIVNRTKAAAKQATINNINSKKHLGTEGDGASEQAADVAMDQETLKFYEGMGMTKAQAVKHHKKLYG